MPTLAPFLNKPLKRFIFCYLLFYIFPYGLEYLYAVNADDLSLWTSFVPWFGKTFLGIDYDTSNLAKGFDSKYDFTRFLLCALFSGAITLVWLIADKKYRWNYEDKLSAALLIILRYHVGFTLILYGVAKVLPLQFGIMGIGVLESPIGTFTPMEFLWAFMSHSRFYAASTGWIEMIAGALLLFRGTTFLGAAISFIVMCNVVLIDIGYDVTVKLFAIHLFVMTILLLTGHVKRMIHFFILNKAIEPVHATVLFSTQRGKLISTGVKSVVLVYFFITTVQEMQKRMLMFPDEKTRALSRFLKVEKFAINGDTLPPLLTDTVRWKSIFINGNYFFPGRMSIKKMNDKRTRFTFVMDTLYKQLTFHSINDSTEQYRMTYEQPDDHCLILQGIHGHDTLWMRTESISPGEYTLTKDGIQWIRDR